MDSCSTSVTYRKRVFDTSRRRDLKRDSPGRSDERIKRYHKPHKKHRRRSRSHSSASSSPMGRRNAVVYMNPAFQSFMGGTSQADMELRSTLINQLSASEQRINSLEAELRAAQLARGRAEHTVYDVNAEKLRLEAQNTEMLQIMKTLERGVEDLQKSCNCLKMECERRKRDLENTDKTLASCKEQNKFLTERNLKLVHKCEELCDENKNLLNRRDESTKELSEIRPRFEALQSDLRQRFEDCRRMTAQLRSFEEKERIWKKEKMDLEKRIEIKDAMAAAERRNSDEWKKRNSMEKAELERKVKLVEPEIRKALEAEAIKKAIEDVRRFYDQKLRTLFSDLRMLKTNQQSDPDGSKNIAKIGLNRPGSAPPVFVGDKIVATCDNCNSQNNGHLW